MKRREFLIATAGFALSVSLAKANTLPSVSIQAHPQTGFNSEQWQTLDQILNHLFPSETNAPGAKDVYATAWLHNALLDKKLPKTLIPQLQQGLIDLENIAKSTFKTTLIQLDSKQLENTLQQLQQTRSGRAWIREIMRYIFEALLTAPVYGGNPNQIGWKWLKHQPGFPLPTPDKRYFKL